MELCAVHFIAVRITPRNAGHVDRAGGANNTLAPGVGACLHQRRAWRLDDLHGQAWTIGCERCGQHGRIVTESPRSEEHTSELQSRFDLVCRLLLEKKKN